MRQPLAALLARRLQTGHSGFFHSWQSSSLPRRLNKRPLTADRRPKADSPLSPSPDIEAEEPSAAVGFSPQLEVEDNGVLPRRYPLTIAAVSHLPTLGNFRMEER